MYLTAHNNFFDCKLGLLWYATCHLDSEHTLQKALWAIELLVPELCVQTIRHHGARVDI